VGKPREREFCNRYQYLLTVFVFDSVTGVPSHVSQEKESRNPALASQEKKKPSEHLLRLHFPHALK